MGKNKFISEDDNNFYVMNHTSDSSITINSDNMTYVMEDFPLEYTSTNSITDITINLNSDESSREDYSFILSHA